MGFECPRQAIEELAGAPSQRQCDLLVMYADQIASASRTMNVLSRASLAQLSEHLVDSAAVLSVIDVEGQKVVDLGSGAGLPGVVVAVLRPSAEVALVESRRRKVAFLKRVQRALGVPNLDVTHARLEDLAGEREFGIGLSRALGSVERTLAPSLRVIADGGRLVLFKGPRWQEEADRARAIAAREGAALERTTEVELPGVGRSTTFVVFHVKRGGP
jgi:16S rRNA (guanine527-N7)-methyltransferase